MPSAAERKAAERAALWAEYKAKLGPEGLAEQAERDKQYSAKPTAAATDADYRVSEDSLREFMMAGFPEVDLDTRMQKNPSTMPADITKISNSLFDPKYHSNFTNMRSVLNVSLYTMLIIDLYGAADFTFPNLRNKEYMCLKWKDIKFYTFQSTSDNKFDIRANIVVHWAKGKTKTLNELQVPLAGLLPPHLALQDTLRLLLLTAVLNGVFPDVRDWEDLLRFRVSPEVAETGRLIGVKKDMQDKAVIRHPDHAGRMTDRPVTPNELMADVKKLGALRGVEAQDAIEPNAANSAKDSAVNALPDVRAEAAALSHDDKALMARLTEYMSVVHSIDRFAPGEEPALAPQGGSRKRKSAAVGADTGDQGGKKKRGLSKKAVIAPATADAEEDKTPVIANK